MKALSMYKVVKKRKKTEHILEFFLSVLYSFFKIQDKVTQSSTSPSLLLPFVPYKQLPRQLLLLVQPNTITVNP